MIKNSSILTLLVFLSNFLFAQLSNPVALVSGKVLDQQDNWMVEANVVYETFPDGKKVGQASTNPDDGMYKIVLPIGKKYILSISADGYYGTNYFIDLTKFEKYIEINDINLYLTPLEVGQIARLNTVNFDSKTKKINPESYIELNRLIDYLIENKKTEIEIIAYSNKKNTSNFTLEQAKTVETYLVNKGISEKRLSISDNENSTPSIPNKADKIRDDNDRIEIKFLTLSKNKK